MAEFLSESSPGYGKTSAANTLFVGRQREISELKAALEDALSGQGRLVMLAGEPGIGKTRTAQGIPACVSSITQRAHFQNSDIRPLISALRRHVEQMWKLAEMLVA